MASELSIVLSVPPEMNPNGVSIRAYGTPDNPEWAGPDIIAVLHPEAGKSQRSSYLRRVPKRWKGMRKTHTPGGEQELTTLKEPGLYHLFASGAGSDSA